MAYSKDQRTVFVQQLVQRTTERELKKYFRKQELKVNEVILLRDKRTGRHKGCAYVEMRRMEDVPKAVALSNQVPSFQRFPILVKASEAEKNYLSMVYHRLCALLFQVLHAHHTIIEMHEGLDNECHDEVI